MDEKFQPRPVFVRTPRFYGVDWKEKSQTGTFRMAFSGIGFTLPPAPQARDAAGLEAKPAEETPISVGQKGRPSPDVEVCSTTAAVRPTFLVRACSASCGTACN